MRSAISRLEARGKANGLAGAQREHHFVLVGFEAEIAAAHQVAHHHVAVLGFQLAARFLLQILGFGGEADQQAVALLAAQFGQDVGRGVEFQRDARGGLLHLLIGDLAQVEIGHGGGLDHDAGGAAGAPSPGRAFRPRCAPGSTSTPRGGARWTGPEIRITRAPRAAAASASA